MAEGTDADKRPEDGTDAKKDETERRRRRALGQIGRFGMYTAPALLALLTGEAHAQVPSGLT
jgi:hypothetical protein